MREIAEKAATERIISHVLNDAAAVSVTVRHLQFLWCRIGESLEEHVLEGGVPHRIDNCFVSENGISVGERGRQENRQKQAEGARKQRPLSSRPMANKV